MIKKLVIIMLLVSAISRVYADDLGDRLGRFAADNAEGYLQPLVNILGASLNSSTFNCAKVLQPARPGIRISGIVIPISNTDKKFTAKPPEGLDYVNWGNEQVRTATIFGKEGKRLGTEEYGLDMPKGLDLDIIIAPQATLSLGLPFGNEAMFRFIPPVKIHDKIGNLSMWGVGLKHSIDQYLPNIIPIDIAVQGMYQNMKVGDLIKVNSIAVDAMVSKKLSLLTFYGGLGFEETSFKVEYDYKPFEETNARKIELDMKTDNNVKATLGMRVNVMYVHLFADYTIANDSMFSFGMGLGF